MIFILCFIFVCFLFLTYDKPPKGTPSISGVPFFQQTFQYIKNSDIILDFFTEEIKKANNKTLTFKILSQPRFYVTCDPKNIEHILKTNFENYGKGPPFFERAYPLLGSGIFNIDNDQWYTQRKISAHMFNVKNFKTGILTSFNKHCDTLVQKFTNYAKSGEKVNVQTQFYKLTLDSFGEIGFGENIGSLTKEHVPFADAFDYCQHFINDSFFNPFWYLKRYLSLSGWRFWRELRVLDNYAYDIIKKHRNDENVSTKNDLLSLFISRKDGNGNNFTDKYLRDVIMNFLLAGRDTTAQALTWCIYNISQDEQLQEKMYEEVKQLENFNDKDCWLDFNSIKKLEFINAVFTETLRLYPSVPKEGKYIFEDDVWPDGTQVKKGCWANFIPYTMGRLEQLWEDPLSFKPERHLGQRHSPFKFIAFQAGPRTCLGQDMAYLEAKCVLARLVKMFKFHFIPGQVVHYENSLTLPTKFGVHVTLTFR